MKKKLARLIFALATILMCATVCGCSIGMDSLDDILEKNDLTARITYFSNGGWFNNDNASVSRDIYYKADSKALEINDTTQTKIKHEKDLYAGWYTILTVELDGEKYFVCDVTANEVENFTLNGESVIKQNNGNYVIKITHYEQLIELLHTDTSVKVPLLSLDAPFNFSERILKEGDRIYLATKWVPNQKVEYILLTEDCDKITVTNDNGESVTLNNGDIVTSKLFDNNGQFAVPTDYDLIPADSSDATFVDYFVYSENTENLIRLADQTQSITRPEDGSNVKVYVKYVAGDWEIVRFAEDFKKVFTSPANKYYVSRDLDCSTIPAVAPTGTFSGTLRGNGHTVSGIKMEGTRLANGSQVAMFGMMTGSAVIKDITLKDVSVKCETRPNVNVNIYLLSHTLFDGQKPTIENVKLSGVKLDISLGVGASIGNIPYVVLNSSYNTDTWICNGFTDNDAFFANYQTFSMDNYQLIINNTTVLTDISVI